MTNPNDFDDELTSDELDFKKIFDEKLKEVDKSFSQMGFNEEQMKQILDDKSGEKDEAIKRKFEKLKTRIFVLPTIDSRGREIFTNEELHQKYNNGYPLLRFTQLPVCYYNYKSKLIFTAPLTFMGAYAFQAKNLLQSGKKLRDMKTKQLALSWAFLYGVCFVVCTLDSLFLDDYCDINSYHYNLNQNRKSMMRDIKKKLKREDD